MELLTWDNIGKVWILLLALTLVFEMYKKIVEKIKN